MKYKKYWIMGICILSGIVAAVFVHLGSRLYGKLQDGTYLYRNEWGEGDYEVCLQGDSKLGLGTVVYEVRERRYTTKELLQQRKKLISLLKIQILNGNEDLNHVCRDLYLPNEVPGYPFQIYWESSNPEYLKSNGTVSTVDISESGIDLMLKAALSYEGERWEEVFSLRVIQPKQTQEEQYLNTLNRLIEENDSKYSSQNKVLLPDRVDGEQIQWHEITVDYSVFFLLLGILAAVLAPVLMERDLRVKEEKRKEEFQRIYPEFISKLQLYIGAGLSIRNAFLRICKDYQEEGVPKRKKEPLYEELVIACNQLLNGQEEGRVYLEFATRCKDMRYRKLSFLLSSSLRQGNNQLLRALTIEAKEALEQRKNHARKRGEEAETKLLFPMMLMLLIVMFLILLPAFGGFRG